MKYTVLIVVALALIGGGLVVHAVYHVVQAFAQTERIVHGGYEITNAIEAYAQAHDHPPEALAQLVPTQLEKIPSIEGVAKIEYALEPKTQTWRLSLHVTDEEDEDRTYLYRSDGSLRPQEQQRYRTHVHGFDVLEAAAD